MASKKELFELLESLEKSEKQAIALERKKQNKTPNYFILYDWLEEWIKEGGDVEEYNREKATKAINEQYKCNWGKRAIETAESQLYSKIIEILANTKQKNLPISIINKDIAQADIFKSKGFYKHALDHLGSASKRAYKYEIHSSIIEIIPRKIDVILLTKFKERNKLVEEAYVELNEANRVIQQETEYRNINVRLFLQFQKSRDATQIPIDLKNDYLKIIEKNFPKEGSFYSKYYFYSMQAIWARLHKNLQAAYDYQSEVVNLWIKHKDIRSQNGQSYLTQLANLINFAIAAKDAQHLKAAKDALNKLQAFKPSNNDEEAEQRQNYLFYKQFLLLNESKFQEALTLIPAIEQLLGVSTQQNDYNVDDAKKQARYKRVNPSRLYNFYFNTLITLLICHKYEEASQWLNHFRQLYGEKSLNKEQEFRRDIQQFIRVLQLIILYGLESDEFSKNMLANLYRRPDIRKNWTKFEELIYNFFDVITNMNLEDTKRKQRKLLQELLQDLEDENKVPLSERRIIGYEEVVTWIKSELGTLKMS